MARVFVLGNAAWDETLRLAAWPVPGVSSHVRRGAAGPGGKSLNQAVTLARAGVPTSLVAAIGDDAAGGAIAAALMDEGLADGLVRIDGVATDWSGVLVAADGRNAVLTTREAAAALDEATLVTALASGGAGDLCVLQGNLTVEATRAAIAAAKRRGMAVAFNPSPADRGFAPLLADADRLFLNLDEARAFAGAETPDAVRAIGAAQTVVTLGADGAMLVAGAVVQRVAAKPGATVDPTGAGDVFMAVALAHAAGRGWQLDAAALEAGAAAAAITVGREGAFAALPTREELAAIIALR